MIIFFCALLVSLLGTVAGFGGGVFIVPIMVVFLGIPIEVAIGVTAISLFPSSLISTLWNLKGNKIDFKLLLFLEIPTMVGAVLGAKLTNIIEARPLEIIFSFFLFFTAWKTYRPSVKKTLFSALNNFFNKFRPKIHFSTGEFSVWVTSFFGSLAGLIAGLFGVGGGIVKTPVMLNIFKAPPKVATATSLCMIVFTSLSSGITHFLDGHTEKNLLLWTSLGFFLGAIIGNILSFKATDIFVKKIIALSIALAALVIFLHIFF